MSVHVGVCVWVSVRECECVSAREIACLRMRERERKKEIETLLLIFLRNEININGNPFFIEGLLLCVGIRYKSDPKGSKIRFVLREVKRRSEIYRCG